MRFVNFSQDVQIFILLLGGVKLIVSPRDFPTRSSPFLVGLAIADQPCPLMHRPGPQPRCQWGCGIARAPAIMMRFIPTPIGDRPATLSGLRRAEHRPFKKNSNPGLHGFLYHIMDSDKDRHPGSLSGLSSRTGPGSWGNGKSVLKEPAKYRTKRSSRCRYRSG